MKSTLQIAAIAALLALSTGIAGADPEKRNTVSRSQTQKPATAAPAKDDAQAQKEVVAELDSKVSEEAKSTSKQKPEKL